MRSLLLAVLVPVCVSALSAQSVDQLRKSFDERCEQAAATRDGQLEKLNTSYLGGLQRLLDKTKASGKLDAALPVHEEIEALKHADPQLPPLPETALPELKQMRGKYQAGRHQILKTHATTLDGLASKMEAALKAREADLTKAGKIDDAVAARESLADMAKDKDLLAARDLLKLGGSTAKGKPALQLRRYGDNLEVIVYYDRAGKVSMDSPVENTRERTGEGKELGDTKAKNLGEFVGAKGYTVDPYVAFEHEFDTTDMGVMKLARLKPTPGLRIEGTKGVKLAYTMEAGPAYALLSEVLPARAVQGTFRISIRYHLPRDNRTVTGLRFVYNNSARIGDRDLSTSSGWAEESIVSVSAHDSGDMYLVPANDPKAKPETSKDDFVVIGQIKVEHLAFSAFVQKQFEPTGKQATDTVDPKLQPLFIMNGDLLGK